MITFELSEDQGTSRINCLDLRKSKRISQLWKENEKHNADDKKYPDLFYYETNLTL